MLRRGTTDGLPANFSSPVYALKCVRSINLVLRACCLIVTIGKGVTETKVRYLIITHEMKTVTRDMSK